MTHGLIDTLSVAAALLLCVSGAAKLRHPASAAAMIRRLLRDRRVGRGVGRPPGAAIGPVRAIGSGELAIGLAVLVTGSRPAAALLAAAYLVFAAVAVLLLRAGGARTSCGCFGATDSPLGPAHLVLDGVALAAGLAAVVRPPGPWCGLDGGGTVAVIGGVQAVLLAALAYLAVTALPALLAARRTLVAAPSSTQET